MHKMALVLYKFISKRRIISLMQRPILRRICLYSMAQYLVFSALVQFSQLCSLDISRWTRNKDTTESASYLDILLNIDSNGRLTPSLYDKRDDFDIVNFPFLCSNIPLSPAYISQLIRYARAYFAYEDFTKRGKLLTNKLMLQGYNESRLK